MKVKFSKFERVAGLFVLTAIFGVVVSFVMVAVEKGWFERKVPLKTTFSSADGLSPGTQVQMNGLRVGSVDDVVLGSDNTVTVLFSVNESIISKVRKDSMVRSFRPFLIGERVLEISVGSDDSGVVARNAVVPSEESIDLMDIIGGRKMGPYIEKLQSSIDNLRVLFDAFQDKERLASIVGLFDQLQPTLKEMRLMAREMKILGRQANGRKRLQRTLNNLLITTSQVNEVLPEVVQVVKNSPDLGKNTAEIVQNLALLTSEMKVLLPALAEIAPDLPQTSRKAIQAMNEALIVLKAMQKSFMLRGAVEDVKEEEEEKRKRLEAESSQDDEDRSPADE